MIQPPEVTRGIVERTSWEKLGAVVAASPELCRITADCAKSIGGHMIRGVSKKASEFVSNMIEHRRYDDLGSPLPRCFENRSAPLVDVKYYEGRAA